MTKTNHSITIEIDRKRYTIDQPAGENNGQIKMANEVYQYEQNGKSFSIKLIEFDLVHRTCTIEINGRQKKAKILRDIDLRIESMGLNASQAKKHETMAAPMPGLVSAIKVKEGDHVEKGTPLLILEAMKMENVIAAPHEAIVKTIKVKVGQAVERGLPLIEFAPAT